MSCVICCEGLFANVGAGWERQAAALLCGHVFHQSCIAAWLAQSGNRTCPTCRSAHRGDPLALFLETEAPGGGEEDNGGGGGPSASGQVAHRNKIIKTLCANVEAAQLDAKCAREALEHLQTRYAELEEQLGNEKDKVAKAKAKVDAGRTTVERLRASARQLERSVAEKSREVEDQITSVRTLTAALAEQRRVVAGLGDVHATNEQLARTLRKERAKLATQGTLNAGLAARVAELEKENAGLRTTAAADGAPAARGKGQPHSFSDNAQVIDLVSEATTDLDLDDDAEAISAAAAAPWEQAAAPLLPRRVGPSFGVSVKEFERSGSLAQLSPIRDGEAALGSAIDCAGDAGTDVCKVAVSDVPFTFAVRTSPNPFAATSRPFSSLVPRNINFTQGMVPKGGAPGARGLPLSRAHKPGSSVSDGMGGAARSAADRRRTASAVQSKISWTRKR
ncbi:hypothetical protein IWQ57_001424 [Coemansia nantahalensis]|uniref:Uncharacterized protein n=1 Tax=Coemansia nantahalensis TaxID=2789366 RepID=A0ACC1K425_9FUNG|nr:hypothetical protein IWQ57_001424 [Coemansia nantahalensis]